MTTLPPSDLSWPACEAWWSGIGERLHVADRAHAFFTGMRASQVFDRMAHVGG